MGLKKDEQILMLAKKYCWWKSPADAAKDPLRIVAQVMNLGDFDDLVSMVDCQGEGSLREALLHAEPGMFNPRSWAYWHYRLGVISCDEAPPPLPVRKVA